MIKDIVIILKAVKTEEKLVSYTPLPIDLLYLFLSTGQTISVAQSGKSISPIIMFSVFIFYNIVYGSRQQSKHKR